MSIKRHKIYYYYIFDDEKVHLGVTTNSLEEYHEFNKLISHGDKLEKYLKNGNYEGPIFLKCNRMYFDDDDKFCEIIKEIKQQYNIKNNQLINSKKRQPRYFV